MLSGDPATEFEVVVFKSGSPMTRTVGTFRSDPRGVSVVPWDLRDSLGARVGRGVYQVTARNHDRFDNKFVVVE